MINLKINNFKCFDEIEIPINNLTILTGANGNGKSTVIQALLLLRRTIEHCIIKDELGIYKLNDMNLELNGSYCLSLGNSLAILPQNTEHNELYFGLASESDEFGVSFEASSDSKLYISPIEILNSKEQFESLFKHEFYYLNAERIGPRVRQDVKFFDYPNTGYKGEFVAQLLGDTEFNYKFKVDTARINKKDDNTDEISNPRLEQQVNAWLNFILPGVTVSAKYDMDTLSAQIKIGNRFMKSSDIIAPNIGFGISYVLPIIVSGLIAKKGAFMIVENPEAHLHPSAQSKIGRFLAMLAKSGVKVIVETHSDHLINGVQIACAKNDIDTNLVSINYFSLDENINQPNLNSISINTKGELSNWPKGFFDQSHRDFAELFKMRKK